MREPRNLRDIPTAPVTSWMSCVRVVTVIGISMLALSACSSTPTTKEQVCGKFDALAQTVLGGNGFGNPVFDAIDELASAAESYQGPEIIGGEAAALKDISEAGETSVGDLEQSTVGLANMCGGPLTVRAFSG